MNQEQTPQHEPSTTGDSLPIEEASSTVDLMLELHFSLLPKLRKGLTTVDQIYLMRLLIDFMMQLLTLLMKKNVQNLIQTTKTSNNSNSTKSSSLNTISSTPSYIDQVYGVFDRYSEVTEHLKNPEEHCDFEDTTHMLRLQALDHTSDALELIDSTIDMFMKDSEIDLIQLNWRFFTWRIDETLKKLLSLIDPRSQDEHEPVHPLRIQAVDLADTIIAIIKLVRLFFRKLPKLGMDKKWPVFTEMSSAEQFTWLTHLLMPHTNSRECWVLWSPV
ncbi:hypothetical protein PTTG_25243 [Puccinia triticina 1-1 BBBD Race 1]|uniref:Uncharacterized protein n=2 Tax=Puccinia triticina TaxID=208348 RepID=A0A180H3S9_PUCT1|nr:uncharacterized protein PtA15_2A465 [Puccinia triticina]OAV99656.1 hypothetical protein PTTG_25243 [Puccinia triticina 1-1 BBBD Race 1]WAQ82150.1 hypothetical protein PtA15_2A465 [Puccinia triticina]WAR53009.1 hypothetical protein PtB15_2B437 [Puccinia triticina]